MVSPVGAAAGAALVICSLREGLAILLAAGAAVVPAAAVYAVGRHGALDFVSAAEWTPPGGWMPWLMLTAAGCLLVALSLVPLTVAEREERYGHIEDPKLVSVSR